MNWVKEFGKSVRLTVIFAVIASLFSQNLINLEVALTYRLNHKYISTTLCENRNKPCMHCNGKCYLRKQLQKGNDEHGKLPVRSMSENDVSLLDLPSGSVFCFLPNLHETVIAPVKTETYTFKAISGIFRPPLSA